DVSRLEDHTHPAAAQPLLELIASVENRLPGNRERRNRAIIRAVVDVIRETVATGWTLFHSLILLRDPERVRTFTKKILAAAERASKQQAISLQRSPAFAAPRSPSLP